MPRAPVERMALDATGAGRRYARQMIGQRQVRIAASASVLLAFAGLWISHTLEYLRVWGSAGLIDSWTNPVHVYMLPLAGALILLGAACGVRLVRTWQGLHDRLDHAAAGLRRIWRGQSAVVSDVPLRSSPGTRLAAIWLPLFLAQVVLYLLQENIEAIARAQPAPGIGAITGIHWAAPIVHCYVALVLACAVRIGQILLHRRAAVVERVEALLRALVKRAGRIAAGVAVPATRVASPLDETGGHLWRRPPPALLDT
jgi:hypothetical protein